MSVPTLPITQINLHHAKSALAILARAMAGRQTGLALVQEPWLLYGAIKGLGGSGTLHWTPSEERQRTCIVAKGLEVTTFV